MCVFLITNLQPSTTNIKQVQFYYNLITHNGSINVNSHIISQLYVIKQFIMCIFYNNGTN